MYECECVCPDFSSITIYFTHILEQNKSVLYLSLLSLGIDTSLFNGLNDRQVVCVSSHCQG